MKDKVMALSLIIKKEPESSLDYIRSLMKQANKKDRKQAFIAIDALQELFGKTLLPEDRKLKSFNQYIEDAQNAKIKITDQLLLKYEYESMLKIIYVEFVDLLGKCTNDPLDFFKKLAVSVIADCLIERPEREETLLNLLINKLGDPNNDIAKATIQHIIRILKKHGNMTQIVTGEIQQYMERVKSKSLYFFVSCLNSIVFYDDDPDYISNVLKIYFSQFKRLNIEREESHKNEVLTLILRGINNIAANLDPGTLETTFNSITEEMDILFRLSNSNSFKVKIEALKLIFQFIKVDQTLNDKFYRTLYKVIASLRNVAAMKLDSTFALIYKAVKKDTNYERAQAFFKRLLQMCYVNEISFAAATILLINEVLKYRKELRSLMFSKEKLLDSDDEEVFVDADTKPKKRNKKAKRKEKEVVEEASAEAAKDVSKDKLEYDPSKLDPQYANADKTAFWELDVLRNYYHPTIREWTQNLILGKEIDYSGDPLQDFSMGNFLDKIILKPAKSAEKLEKMKFKKKRSARAEEIKKAVKNTEIEEKEQNFKDMKSKIQQNGEFRADEEFLYKHLLLKTKKEKQARQRLIDAKDKSKVEEEKEREMDALDDEVADFEMSEEDLPSDFFDGEEDLQDVPLEEQPADEKVFEEAPSDFDD